MRKHASSSQFLVTSCALVATVLLCQTSHARAGLPIFKSAEFEEVSSLGQADTIEFTFEGSVHLPDGAPAQGAVVVSSAGGQAVANSDGTFALTAWVPRHSESLHLTAVGVATSNLIANQELSLLTSSLRVEGVALQLAVSSTCTPQWLPTFGGARGTNRDVIAVVVFDDGNGPALYVSGSFSTAGGLPARRFAKWDGVTWEEFGTGVDASVLAFAVFDDGAGSALYVGGSFNTIGGTTAFGIAKWDGTTWSPLGGGIPNQFESVQSLAVFDDGTGSALYAGGSFPAVGGVPAEHIARWDGSAWSAVGSGIGGDVYTFIERVNALFVFDAGDGAKLYAGGLFPKADGLDASNIAAWDGSSWSPLGSGVNDVVYAITAFDDGTGEALYVGGDFTSAGTDPANRIAKWDGSSWETLGSGFGIGDPFGGPSRVSALTVFDDGSGEALYAGGEFLSANDQRASNCAKWDGASWSRLGTLTGTGSAPTNGIPHVRALGTFGEGNEKRLIMAGSFSKVDGMVANNIASWDGTRWASMGFGSNEISNTSALNSFIPEIKALAVYDDGNGEALYVGGEFTSVGELPVTGIAKWNGSQWRALGTGITGAPFSTPAINAIEVFDDGGGAALYIGGVFTNVSGVDAMNIAKWDGSTWTTVGRDMGAIRTLKTFDDGSGNALYAGGLFTKAGGGTANRIARWNGSTWGPVGLGFNQEVKSLTSFDDGGGESLYAAGLFFTSGAASVRKVGKWDGSTWNSLGTGIGGLIANALVSFDDGTGASLYAAGNFSSAGGVGVANIARWDGTSWASVGSGIDNTVHALAVFDDGTGAALFAAGDFTTAGGTVATGIAKWTGAAWLPVGSGLNVTTCCDGARALAVFNDGDGPGLYVGGIYSSALDSGDSYLAQWACARD